MSTARIVMRRPFSLTALLFVLAATMASGACNSTKPNDYTPPKEASQARCTESHSADGACAASEAADE